MLSGAPRGPLATAHSAKRDSLPPTHRSVELVPVRARAPSCVSMLGKMLRLSETVWRWPTSVLSLPVMGWGSSVRVALSAAGFWVAAISATAAADDAAFEPCTLVPGPTQTVARVLDAETLVLDDGTAVRLIGALAPRARDAGAQAGTWPPEIDAIKFLSDLVLGKKVKLAFGDASATVTGVRWPKSSWRRAVGTNGCKARCSPGVMRGCTAWRKAFRAPTNFLPMKLKRGASTSDFGATTSTVHCLRSVRMH